MEALAAGTPPVRNGTVGAGVSAAPRCPMLVPALLLALARAPSDPERAPLAGWYELVLGHHALVTFGASGGLRLFDFERPSFDVLEASDAGFRWRRQHEPGEARLEFARDERGAVTGFAWSTAAGERGQARRDDAFGYAQDEVRFRSGEVELCALVLVPRGEGPHPGAVVIQGSGDSDRDNVWACTIANHLALAGLAGLLPH